MTKRTKAEVKFREEWYGWFRYWIRGDRNRFWARGSANDRMLSALCKLCRQAGYDGGEWVDYEPFCYRVDSSGQRTDYHRYDALSQ